MEVRVLGVIVCGVMDDRSDNPDGAFRFVEQAPPLPPAVEVTAAERLVREICSGAGQSFYELSVLYEQHLKPLRPQRVLEIGTDRAGLTGLFCHLVGDAGRVVSIDVRHHPTVDEARARWGFEFIQGSSRDPEVVARVKSLFAEVDLLMIDGDHSHEGVLGDTEQYLPLLRPGGLAVWHDVRLEPRTGIKFTWYETLRRRLPSAFELYENPDNTGYGLWYKTDTTMADALYAANALARDGDSEAAEAGLRKLLQQDPRHEDAWHSLASLFRTQGRATDAHACATLAVGWSGTPKDTLARFASDIEGPAPEASAVADPRAAVPFANRLETLGAPTPALAWLGRAQAAGAKVQTATTLRLMRAADRPLAERMTGILDALAGEDTEPEILQELDLLCDEMVRVRRGRRIPRFLTEVLDRAPTYASRAARRMAHAFDRHLEMKPVSATRPQEIDACVLHALDAAGPTPVDRESFVESVLYVLRTLRRHRLFDTAGTLVEEAQRRLPNRRLAVEGSFILLESNQPESARQVFPDGQRSETFEQLAATAVGVTTASPPLEDSAQLRLDRNGVEIRSGDWTPVKRLMEGQAGARDELRAWLSRNDVFPSLADALDERARVRRLDALGTMPEQWIQREDSGREGPLLWVALGDAEMQVYPARLAGLLPPVAIWKSPPSFATLALRAGDVVLFDRFTLLSIHGPGVVARLAVGIPGVNADRILADIDAAFRASDPTRAGDVVQAELEHGDPILALRGAQRWCYRATGQPSLFEKHGRQLRQWCRASLRDRLGASVRGGMLRSMRFAREPELVVSLCDELAEDAPADAVLHKESAMALMDCREDGSARKRLDHPSLTADADARYFRLLLDGSSVTKEPPAEFDLASTPAAESVSRLVTDGTVFLRGALAGAGLAALRREVDGRGPLSSRQLALFSAAAQETGLDEVLRQRLGNDYRFGDQCMVRVVESGSGYHMWHQDFGTSNHTLDYLTLFCPLVRCGDHAPAIEVFPHRFSTLFPYSDERAEPPYKQSRFAARSDLLARAASWAPRAEPGDIVIFDKWMLHRTQPLTGAVRRGVEVRLYANQ